MQARMALFAVSLVGALCAGPVVRASAAGLPATQTGERLVETGIATWYGGHRAWHRTASGERFEPAKMTAAHHTLPLGTVVRVTDLVTGRSVVVRINDREPAHRHRCIDLSEGAANALGIHNSGVAQVTIVALNVSDPVEVAEAPMPETSTAKASAPVHHRRARH